MPRLWTEFRDEQNPENHWETRWEGGTGRHPNSNGNQEAVKRPRGRDKEQYEEKEDL